LSQLQELHGYVVQLGQLEKSGGEMVYEGTRGEQYEPEDLGGGSVFILKVQVGDDEWVCPAHVVFDSRHWLAILCQDSEDTYLLASVPQDNALVIKSSLL
jgi:hypothetical protein